MFEDTVLKDESATPWFLLLLLSISVGIFTFIMMMLSIWKT